MGDLLINISQVQAVMLLAQAQSSLTLVVQALQQAITAAQTAGNANVSLTAEALQGFVAQVQLAAEAVVQARVRQQQRINVRIRRPGEDIRIRTRQMQVGRILAEARSSLSASLRAIQQLQTMAQAMGGTATVAVGVAQQLLAGIQAAVMAVATAALTQQQTVMVLAGQA